MNYRHIFHAGNFADVFKHWILSLLLEKLTEKANPYCYFDLHGGIGVYNLDHVNARKTLEADSGINLMLQNSDPIFASYLAIIQQLRANGANLYPGSPKIAEHFLRKYDRMFIAELHRDDYAELASNFNKKQIKIFNQNGYEMLKANLPPLEKRGLVLFDAPFEANNEFALIAASLQEAYNRFATGVYAIWYPIKDQYTVNQFYQAVGKIGFSKMLAVEMHTNFNVANNLASCGMVIINAPWKLDEQITYGMPRLLKQLDFQHGSYQVKEL